MLFFNSQKIPELAGLNFSQRMQVMRTAADRLPVPAKITLNIIKLVILSLMFILIARSEGWLALAYILSLLILYPLITRPLTFALCRSQLPQIRRQLFGNSGSESE